MLWNDDSFYFKVVFYQATFFIMILQPMPLPNLPIRAVAYNNFSKPVLMCPFAYVLHREYTIVCCDEVCADYRNQ